MRCFIVLAALGAACVAEDYTPDVGPPLAGACDPADSDPDTEVRFGRDIRPMFGRPRGEAGCSCHMPSGGGTPSGIALGGLDLGSFHSFRQGGTNSGDDIVVPGDPCASLLLDKLSETPSFGGRMPLDGPPYLTAEERQRLHDWIAEGATDN